MWCLKRSEKNECLRKRSPQHHHHHKQQQRRVLDNLKMRKFITIIICSNNNTCWSCDTKNACIFWKPQNLLIIREYFWDSQQQTEFEFLIRKTKREAIFVTLLYCEKPCTITNYTKRSSPRTVVKKNCVNKNKTKTSKDTHNKLLDFCVAFMMKVWEIMTNRNHHAAIPWENPWYYADFHHILLCISVGSNFLKYLNHIVWFF